MIRDTWTIIWKEFKELIVTCMGRPASGLIQALLVIVFGVVAPWWWGREWLSNSQVSLVWVLLPIPLVISAAAESFAGERERHTLETLLASPLPDKAILTGKIVAASLCGWLTSVAVLILGLLTVNLVYAADAFLLYTPLLGVGSLALGLLASALTAIAGVVVSLRVTTVRKARLTLTLLVLVLGFVFAALSALSIHLMPSAYQLQLAASLSTPPITLLFASVALALLLADTALYLVAARCFRRRHLLTD